MKVVKSLYLFGLLLFLPLSGWSQFLLTEVPSRDLVKIQSDNEYYLRKYAYISSQQKIVRVNVGLLREMEQFEIPLFDVTKHVRTTSIVEHPSGRYFNWRGIDRQNDMTIEELKAALPNETDAESTFDTMYGLSIAASLYEVDPVSNINLPVGAAGIRDPREARTAGRHDARTFYGVEAFFTHLDSGRTFQLIPLGVGSGFHLLYEVDPNKVARPGHYGRLDSQIEVDKRERAAVFLESLGEDPRRIAAKARAESRK